MEQTTTQPGAPDTERLESTAQDSASVSIQLTSEDRKQLYLQVVIEEFQALYAANNTRVSERNTLLFGVVTFAGALLAIAVQSGALPREVALLYPAITFFLALAWSHNDDHIGKNNRDIAAIERLSGYDGAQTRRTRSRKRSRWPAFVAARIGKQNLATLGTFGSADVLALYFGGVHPAGLFVVALLFAIAKVAVIRHDRD